MRKCVWLYLFSLLAAVSCQQQPKNLMPDLVLADSATIMFYKNPPNPRFFTINKVKDVHALQQVIDDANGPVVEGFETCASWGKIYFYKGKEEVLVVYFTPEKSCRVLSFIINGKKYMVRMSDSSATLLNNLKLQSVELPTNAS